MQQGETTLQDVLEAVNTGFESLESRMNARFEAVNQRFEDLESRMNARFEQVDRRFDRIEGIVDKWPAPSMVDGLFTRVSHIERKLDIKPTDAFSA